MRYFYDTKAMRHRLAGKSYSPAKGVWVTGDRIIFGEIRIPAGPGSRLHRHPNEQFLIVQKGRLEVEVEGKKKTLSPGDLVHIPAGALHRAGAVGSGGVTFITAKDTSWGIEGTLEHQEAETPNPSRSLRTAARKKPRGGPSRARKRSSLTR